MAKVSIVVPIYNVEKYLGECLESLCAQTITDIEIICVNDGSKDNSLNIIKEFANKNSNIKYIDKENEGYGKTVNRGIKEATGEYIAILESDDFIKPEMYENLLKIAQETDADIVKCDFYNYWGTTGQTTQVDQYPEEILNKTISAKDYIKIFSLQPAVWSALYKKDFLEKNNIKFLETAGASYQDISFCFKCYALAKKLRFTNEAYLYYRQDNMGSSVNNKSKVYCIKDELDEIDRFISEHEIKDLSNVIAYLKYSHYSWNLKRISEGFHEEFIHFMSKELNKIELSSEYQNMFSKKQIKDYNLIKENPKKYLKKLKRKLLFRKLKEIRKNLISVRKHNSRLQISILGKTII